MSKRRSKSAFISVLMALSMGVLAHAPAYAEPLPAQYSGSTSGDVLSLGLSGLGVPTIDADIGNSATDINSTEDPRAHAESSNVGANALGLPVDLISGEANSGPGTPTDSYAMGLGDITVPGVLNVGALQGSGSTNWPGGTSPAFPTARPSPNRPPSWPTPTSGSTSQAPG
ncbi:hypothetical protein QFW96_14775 [Saccharopolyspora sp. TS4A08]|uniref:Uncharacterized protein n=1 Tax=Saccharopolyspora ipomoeae TaxID=3042027 RepID=A0ABT6PPG3_9PSEU|nr:hypothetical protein [Saccharopolyspora sp. TS4A08]MDI2029892.1 hypothetical protein [Saccharopolyspora sp. TS4A08]